MNLLKRLFTIKKVKGCWYWGLSDNEIKNHLKFMAELKEKMRKYRKEFKSKFAKLKKMEMALKKVNENGRNRRTSI